MRSLIAFTLGLALFGAGACATAPDAGPVVKDLSPIQTESASAHARFYADCIAQAAANRTYGRTHDDDNELILFTCTGAPARAFYDGLAARSAAVGSEFADGGRTFRSTNLVIRNLFGVDYCSTDGGADYVCVLTLNAGAFLAE